MCAANAGTPKLIRAGAVITAQMMYEAVTGTAKPTTQTIIAVKIAVNNKEPSANWMMMELNLRPKPVKVTVPTIKPAPIQVAAILITPDEPLAKALIKFDS